MQTIEALQTRVSVPRLKAPGPDAGQLERLLQAAVRAPDHGLMRPWRFLVLSGRERQRLGEILAHALLEKRPQATPAELDKIRAKPMRAPTVIVAVAEVEPEHAKIPVIDQIMSTAAAVQNMMVAAHEMGLGAMWRTGSWALDPFVKEGLGFAEKDEIVAFLYLGTPAGARKAVPDEPPERYLRHIPEQWAAE